MVRERQGKSYEDVVTPKQLKQTSNKLVGKENLSAADGSTQES